MSWGEELWDKYEDVVSMVNQGTRELDTFYKGFLKERSRVENEYAKQLRKLIKMYAPKTKKKTGDEESSQTQGFRLILEELGYQAGQHELIAESFGKEFTKEIGNRVNDVKQEMRTNRKEAETCQQNLSHEYKALDDAKLKYQKSHIELEIAKTTYAKTEADGTVSRNEVEKMKTLTQNKTRNNDHCNMQYASQLIKTNETQQEHFFTLLPGVLNNMQSLSVGNCNFFKELMSKCVKSERDIAPIVAKCREEMERAIEGVDCNKDCEIIVNKFKTGNVPPEDFTFEELHPGMEVNTNTLRRTPRSRSKTNLTMDSPNPFQRKRELAKKIETQEKEVSKVQNEMKALQIMVKTYTETPQYGDVKKFQGELETATHRCQVLESDLNAFKAEHADVNNCLENIRSKSPSVGRKYSTQSQLSNSSSSSTFGTLDRKNPKELHINSSTLTTGWDDDFDYESDFPPTPLDQPISIPIPPPMQGGSIPPPPPPPPSVVAPIINNQEPQPRKVAAMYNYDSDTTDTISMAEGEEFFVIQDDQDGWTKVGRIDTRFFEDMGEGFVPSSFLQDI